MPFNPITIEVVGIATIVISVVVVAFVLISVW